MKEVGRSVKSKEEGREGGGKEKEVTTLRSTSWSNEVQLVKSDGFSLTADQCFTSSALIPSSSFCPSLSSPTVVLTFSLGWGAGERTDIISICPQCE